LPLYTLHFTERDLTYMDSLDLSEDARVRIDRFVEEYLTRVPSEDRTNPDVRLVNEPVFWCDFFFLDADHAGIVWSHNLRFYVDDSKAEDAVLSVVLVDYRRGFRWGVD
jgi:hypothetical protein